MYFYRLLHCTILNIHQTEKPSYLNPMYSCYNVPLLHDFLSESPPYQSQDKLRPMRSLKPPLQKQKCLPTHFLYGQQHCLSQPYLSVHRLLADKTVFHSAIFLKHPKMLCPPASMCLPVHRQQALAERYLLSAKNTHILLLNPPLFEA